MAVCLLLSLCYSSRCVVNIDIALAIGHEYVKLQTSIFRKGLNMGTRGNNVVAVVKVGNPVTDLFSLVERLANQAFIVVLPR